MGGILGMCICNDRRWSETYRVMGLQGVELIVLGYNTPSLNSEKADEGPEKRMFHHRLTVQAGAYQNSTWVVAVAKSGTEDGHPLIADSIVVDPDGEIVAEAKTEDDELLVASCDLRLRAPPSRRALRPHHQPDRGRSATEDVKSRLGVSRRAATERLASGWDQARLNWTAPNAMVTAACVGSITGMPSSSSSGRRWCAIPAQPMTTASVPSCSISRRPPRKLRCTRRVVQ
jgi:hypothetical protein